MRSLSQLPPSNDPGIIHVVVESPRGSTTKLKYDEELETFVLSRPLPLGLVYPHDWGFVPGTRAEDGDPLDAMVLTEGTTYPGVVVRARPIGVVKLEQDAREGRKRVRNDRVIAVPDDAPRTLYRSAEQLPLRVRQELEQFFLAVTFLQRKNAQVLGWAGPQQALELVEATSLARSGGKRREAGTG
jgi:inorganic pyrophosphatase